MRKVLSVLLMFLLVSSMAVFGLDSREDEDPYYWGAIKFGYGNETGGIGGALETKGDFLGLWLGVGYFRGGIGGSVGLKLHHNISDTASIWISGGYGLLGVLYETTWSSSSGTSSSATPLWGAFSMIGVTNANLDNRILLDAGVGLGWSPTVGSSIIVLQTSIGYITDIR